jgi:acetylornithine deacetylase/succinyl-diaminopimelate desuccinylase-like protein
VVDLARELIRIDTSNPPGRETPAAEHLARYLAGAGVECELAGPDPERLNLIARLEGAGTGPSLMLMAHTDVVPAPRENWTVDPFEGCLRDGQLVGRGAVDMKSELAARAVALAVFARGGGAPAGDVVLVAEADEERNVSDVGMSWLARERADIRCDYALNEGGGELLELADGHRVVTVSIGEKQATSLRVRVLGTAGHASVPAGTDNALRHVATAIERLLDYEPASASDPALDRALEALGAPSGSDGEAVEWAASQHPLLANLLPAMMRMTVTPTGLRTTEPANVIPPCADVVCDCRALPGQTVDDIHEHVRRAVGSDFRYEVELLEPLVGGTESPTDTPLYRTIEAYVAQRLPGAVLFPVVTPGFTDSHWIRDAHGTVAYGFAPVFSMDARAYESAAHGADEALDVADLVEMTEFHLHVLRTW